MLVCIWRWQEQARVRRAVDHALEAIEQDNAKLKGILNKRYTSLQIDPAKLGELIDLIAMIPFKHDSLMSPDRLVVKLENETSKLDDRLHETPTLNQASHIVGEERTPTNPQAGVEVRTLTPTYAALQDLIDLNIIQIGDGYRATNSELSSEGYPFARAGNLNNGFNFREADKFSIKNRDKVGYPAVRPEVIISSELVRPTDSIMSCFSLLIRSLFEQRHNNLVSEVDLKGPYSPNSF